MYQTCNGSSISNLYSIEYQGLDKNMAVAVYQDLLKSAKTYNYGHDVPYVQKIVNGVVYPVEA